MKPILVALILAVAVTAAVYAAKPTVNPDEPIILTKGMYADLLCTIASEYDPYKGGFQLVYAASNGRPLEDTVRITFMQPQFGSTAKALSECKAAARLRAGHRINIILPKLIKHVSPRVEPDYFGF